MFSHRIRMMSFVERWNIAPRSYRQNVAEHSYYVAIYASEIAEGLSLSITERLNIIDYALRHDVAEIVTGDMPGPAKRAVVNRSALDAYEKKFLDSVDVTLPSISDKGRAIVKAADTIDAFYWTALELAQGNQMMRREYRIAQDRMETACEAVGAKLVAWKVTIEAESLLTGIELAPRLDTDLPNLPDEEIPF